MKYFLLSVYLAGDFSARRAIILWHGINRVRMLFLFAGKRWVTSLMFRDNFVNLEKLKIRLYENTNYPR